MVLLNPTAIVLISLFVFRLNFHLLLFAIPSIGREMSLPLVLC